MKLKGLIIALCMVLLCGCQSSKQEGGLDMYKGMDGKETYEAAMKYFNKTVKYYRQEKKKDVDASIYEYCLTSKGKASLTLYKSSSNSLDIFLGSANHNGQQVLAKNEVKSTILKVTTNKFEERKSLYGDMTDIDGVTVKGIERIDEKDNITLNIKLENNTTNKTYYQVRKIVINNEGLISSEQVIFYGDSSFSKAEGENEVEYYEDINKVNEEEFMKKYDTYLEAIKACDGLTIDEGYTKLKDLI